MLFALDVREILKVLSEKILQGKGEQIVASKLLSEAIVPHEQSSSDAPVTLSFPSRRRHTRMGLIEITQGQFKLLCDIVAQIKSD